MQGDFRQGAAVSIFEAKRPIAGIRNVFTCSLNVRQGFSNLANFDPDITQLPEMVCHRPRALPVLLMSCSSVHWK